MNWLDALFTRLFCKQEPGVTMATQARGNGSMASYLDVVATNLETAGMAIRRIAQRLREAAQEMEDLDG